MAWTIVLLDVLEDWYMALDGDTAEQVAGALQRLEEAGPALGRPTADVIHGSKIHNLKELRPGSAGRSEVRILFVFDPARMAVLLVAGDKAGNWKDWYKVNIPIAEERYDRWLAGDYDDER